MQPALITVLLASLAAVATWNLKPERNQSPSAPPIVLVQEMGTLITLRVNYADVIEFNEPLAPDIPFTQREIPLGGSRVLLVARGECLIGPNLKLAKYEKVQPTGKVASLSLPNPKVVSARLNHDAKAGGSYIYTITKNGLAALLPVTEGQTKAVNGALQKGQAKIEASCARPELIEAAKKSAQAVLQPTFSATGWKIETVWR